MNTESIYAMFNLKGKVIAITGGGGVLCSRIALALGEAGAKVALLERKKEKAERVAQRITAAGGDAAAIQCDVLDRQSVEFAAQQIIEVYGKVDVLINGAGGNDPQATTSKDNTFFDLPADAIQSVFNVNILGSLLPSQVFGRWMADARQGVILNISSMNAFRPLTRVPAYSAAKSAISNFTQWLAVHMAQEYSPLIRVNAIAPGFFLTDQNRYLLTEPETGGLTERGQAIITHTPMNRFGSPEDLIGTVFWLISPASAFVTGIVVPIDGGFSSYSGV